MANIVELAIAAQRGELTLEQAVAGFVSHVLAMRVPQPVLDAILADEILSARFEALFAELAARRVYH